LVVSPFLRDLPALKRTAAMAARAVAARMGLRFHEGITMEQMTPAFIEERLPHMRWCAYKGAMLHIDNFSLGGPQVCAS
jgi:hypothetical protein